uniref:Uncharacterized protein n=1 Tax=viral metagenome TaxID=1070528 RepID=A0A6C0K072_9ZZZZ
MRYFWVDQRGRWREISRWSGPNNYPLDTARSRKRRVMELVDDWGGYGVVEDNYGNQHQFYPVRNYYDYDYY